MLILYLLLNYKFKRNLNRTTTLKLDTKNVAQNTFCFKPTYRLDGIKNIKFSIHPIADASCIYLIFKNYYTLL